MVSKRCPRCGQDKEVNSSNFHTDRTRPSGYYPICKPCVRTDRDAKFAAHKEEINAIKAIPCADCAGVFPPYVMDLDHVRGTKRSPVSWLVSRSYGRSTILAEAEKCDVVCANCHRIRTHTRGQWGNDRVIPRA